MTKWRQHWTAWLLVLICTLTLSPPALAAEEKPTRAEAAQAAAETAMEYGGAVSVQYALWQDGEITLSGTAGVYSKSENRLLTGDNLYGIGSISKTYTAALVMKLAEAGKVELDKPVTAYLPDFKMSDPRYKDITVRMLLNHSSGLMGTTNTNAFLLGDPAEDDARAGLLARLADQRLQADPGAYSVYCNDGFTLAELVIEAVSGRSYTEFLRETITGPLHLDHTFTPMDGVVWSDLARIYQGEDPRALPAETLAVIGAGGIYANASDLAAFGGTFCNDSLLTEASRQAMAADEYLRGMWPDDSEGDALAYGLGWDSVHMFPFHQNGIQALVKGGDTIYYHAGLVVLPEHNMAAAVLTSGGVSTYNELAAARMLIDALAEQGIAVNETAALPETVPAETIPADVAALAGDYGSSTAFLKVLMEGNTLTLQLPEIFGGTAQTFTYCQDGSFRDETGTIMIRLVTEDNGQTYLFQKAYTPLPGLTAVCSANYGFERLPEGTADETPQAAWHRRGARQDFLMNDNYTPSFSPMGGVAATTADPSLYPAGYLSTNVITAPDLAESFVQIPGTGSRDGGDILAYTENGAEWLAIGSSLFREAGSLETLYNGERAICTIQPDGFARWYHVGEAAGKTMTVTLPESGGFYVYDANLQLTASSWCWGDAAAVLPEGGYIVFAGDAGQVFRVLLSEAEK